VDAFNVSDNIGFDGQTYHCRRCGKAGYQRPTQVRGHLAMCPGTLARKGIALTAPATTQNQLQPVASGYNQSLSGGQLLPVPVVATPQSNQLVGRIDQLDNRLARMENEYNHVVQQVNPVLQEKSWIERNLMLVVLGGILLYSFLSSMSRSQQCVSGSSENSSSGPNFKKLSERVVNKAADIAISKGIGKMFA